MNTALITGGTGAIGKALVEAFSADYDVIFTYNTDEEGAKALSGKSGARAVKCDLSDKADIKRFADITERCDVLVNNAGISQIKLFTDITDEDWERMLSVNLSGVFYLTRAILPKMISRKNGAIINISSVWGVYGASCEVHYSAAKAGIIGMTKALAKEAGPSGITVNAIAPGVIESPMNAHLSPEETNGLIEETPLERLGKPSDVASAALFLARSGFITGQVLGVDGGFGL